MLAYIWYSTTYLRITQKQGCLPIARSANRDPFLGLDRIPSVIRAVREHKILDMNCQLFREYGRTFKAKELLIRAIVTIEPENIKTVLSLNFTDYGIGHRLDSFKPLLGEGIFDTDGDHWSSSRALIRPVFNSARIADLTSLEGLVKEMFLLLPRDGETVIDLQPIFFRLTMDSATDFLFGESVGALSGTQSKSDFAQAFDYAQKAIITRSLLGPFRILFPDRKADECNQICRVFAQRFVDQAFDALPTKGMEDDNLRKHTFSHQLASQTTDKVRVLDEIMNVLVAGRDTTASLLSNLFFTLAKRPKIWDKLRREVADLQGLPPTYEELQKLRYVQCCIKESLRLHPVVPRNGREAIRDTILPIGGGIDGLSPVFVPKGTLVAYNVFAMHRREDIYGPDAEDFHPERWEDGHLQPRWGYLPFNGGPRVCIGQRFALTEAGYVLVRMIQKISRLECRDLGPWEESLGLTLCSRNGVKVSMT